MKNEIRKEYKVIRKNIANKEEKDYIIFTKLIHNPKILSSNTILTYVSTSDEVDTIKLIKYFLETKKVAVPKVQGDTMNFYYINSLDDLEIGNYNILEPTTQNIVTNFNNTISITPGICFSKDLYRIGYGKGYYDRFYQKHDIYCIGICYQKCLLNNIPHNQYDIKVNEIITEEKE